MSAASVHTGAAATAAAARSLGPTARAEPPCLWPPLTAAAAPSLGECFALFELVHTLTTTHEAMTRLTREAMEDFRADGVMYLELRTTPKVRCRWLLPAVRDRQPAPAAARAVLSTAGGAGRLRGCCRDCHDGGRSVPLGFPLPPPRLHPPAARSHWRSTSPTCA